MSRKRQLYIQAALVTAAPIVYFFVREDFYGLTKKLFRIEHKGESKPEKKIDIYRKPVPKETETAQQSQRDQNKLD